MKNITIHGTDFQLIDGLWTPTGVHSWQRHTDRGMTVTEFDDFENKFVRLVQKPGCLHVISSRGGDEFVTNVKVDAKENAEFDVESFSTAQLTAERITPGVAVLRATEGSEDLASLLVLGHEGESLVSARKLHAVLNVGRDFSTWINGRVESLDAELGVDYFTEETAPAGNKSGRNRVEFFLTLDMAKHLAMMEKKDISKKVRTYFIEFEKRNRGTVDMRDPLQVAKLYVESEEQRRKAVANLEAKSQELVEVKAEVEQLVEKLEAPNRGVTFKQFFKETASVLGYSSLTGYKYLRDVGILVKGQSTKWDVVHMVSAEYDRKGLFQVRNVKYPRPVKKDDGSDSDSHRYVEVEKPVIYLTPDVKDSAGNVTRIGGYTWLLRKMIRDERTTLSRLIAAEGGPSGPWKVLYGKHLVKTSDQTLLVYPVKDAINYQKTEAGGYQVCSNIDSKKIMGHGVTLQDALRSLLRATRKSAVEEAINKNTLSEQTH